MRPQCRSVIRGNHPTGDEARRGADEMQRQAMSRAAPADEPAPRADEAPFTPASPQFVAAFSYGGRLHDKLARLCRMGPPIHHSKFRSEDP